MEMSPREVHLGDQAETAYRVLARGYAAMYRTMVELGTPPEHAAAIVAAWAGGQASQRGAVS